MKKFIIFVVGILVGFIIFVSLSGYRVTIKSLPFTNKFIVVVTKKKSLYLRTYGPYTNPLPGR